VIDVLVDGRVVLGHSVLVDWAVEVGSKELGGLLVGNCSGLLVEESIVLADLEQRDLWEVELVV
jgi:hypothetical protein